MLRFVDAKVLSDKHFRFQALGDVCAMTPFYDNDTSRRWGKKEKPVRVRCEPYIQRLVAGIIKDGITIFEKTEVCDGR